MRGALARLLRELAASLRMKASERLTGALFLRLSGFRATFAADGRARMQELLDEAASFQRASHYVDRWADRISS
jgi:hypothetical protein